MSKTFIGGSGLRDGSNEALVRQIFKTLMPIQVLSAATPTLSSILNGLLIGNYLPPEALVALGFVVPLNALLGALPFIVSSGARILCGRFIGRGEIKKIDYAYTASMIWLCVVGALLTLITVFGSTQVALLFGAKGTATAATAEYIRGIGLGILPMLITPCLMVFLQMEDESGYAFVASLVLAAGGLVFGVANLRLFGATIYGMGIASSLSQFVTMLFLVIHIMRSDKLMGIDFSGVNFALIREITVIGFPSAFCMILYALRNATLNTVALKAGGDTAVAALAIYNSAAGPFDAVNVGFGAVVLMFGSVIVGERNNELLKAFFKSSIRIGVIICGLKGVVFCVCSRWLAVIFGAEGELVGMTVLLLSLYATTMPLNAVTQVFVSLYQNLGRLRYINILYIFNCYIFPVGIALLTSGVIGLTGIWMCFGVAEALTVTLMFVIPRLKNRHSKYDVGTLLMLGDEKADAPKLSIPIRTTDDAIGSSKAVMSFCESHGIEKRRSMLSALCCEEMAVNIVMHGFKKTKKKDLSVEIFVLIEDGIVHLRIMDNAVHFDPHDKLKLDYPDDPSKNIGIRMVAKIADEMEYRNTFGMNVLRIKLM